MVCRIQNARFLSSKKGWSRPIPRAIGAAGDEMAGASGGGERRRAVCRRSRVALSVAIADDIEAPCGLCERPAPALSKPAEFIANMTADLNCASTLFVYSAFQQ